MKKKKCKYEEVCDIFIFSSLLGKFFLFTIENKCILLKIDFT